MAVGKKLDEILKSRGLTQKEVADKAGIKPQTLNNLITRDSARADIQILLKICKALSIDMSVFDDDALEEFYKDHPKANPLTISKELTPRQERIVQLFVERIDISAEKETTAFNITSTLNAVVRNLGCGSALAIFPEILFLYRYKGVIS